MLHILSLCHNIMNKGMYKKNATEQSQHIAAYAVITNFEPLVFKMFIGKLYVSVKNLFIFRFFFILINWS